MKNVELSYLDGEKLANPEGWLNPLARDGGFSLAREDGKPLIANRAGEWAPGDKCLVTGDYLWRDYAIESNVRLISHVTLQTNDHERGLPARSGLVLRYRTLRHYYFYCLEARRPEVFGRENRGFRRKGRHGDKLNGYLALYHRWDDTWEPLARKRMRIDPERYYELKAELEGGKIRCYLDEKFVFDAEDANLPRGKAGIRANAESRFGAVRVWTTADGMGEFKAKLAQTERELMEQRGQYPKPVLCQQIDISSLGGGSLRFAHISNSDKFDLVLLTGNLATAFTGEGEMLWQVKFPEDRKGALHCCDIDADGVAEIVTFVGNELVVINPETGEFKARREFPDASPYEGGIWGARANPHNAVDPIYIANFLGGETRQILFKGGAYWGAWAFDHNLELLWERPNVKYGHHLDCYDIDGDGREEAIAGHTVVNGEEEVIALTEGAWRRTQPYHADRPIGADIDGNPENGPEIAMVCGNLGFLLVDGHGNIISEVPVGHAQTLSVGNFRNDLPGLQIWTCTRWGNYGVRTLFDSRGRRIFEWEPDNGEEAGKPCNWSGDGEELTFRVSSGTGGLYDAWGRCVVEFPQNGGSPVGTADVTGDPRDELIFMDGENISIYTQDKPYEGEKIYAPIRKHHQSQGLCSLPRWLNRKDGTYEKPPVVCRPRSPVELQIKFPQPLLPPEDSKLVASIELEGCPEIPVNPDEQDTALVEQVFAKKWTNPLQANGSPWGILHDAGHPVLCNLSDSVGPHDACLTTGNEFWTDYIIEANVRLLSTLTIPSSFGPGRYVVLDDPDDRRARAGLMLRYQHLRQYYWYGIEVGCVGPNNADIPPSQPTKNAKLVLYRRSDRNRAPLASRWIPFDADRYYNLRVEIEGEDIRCYLNGKLAFEVSDDAFASGKAGLRTNTDSRFEVVRVWMNREALSKRRMKEVESVARIRLLREKYPQPQLIKSIQAEETPSGLSVLPMAQPLIVAQMESGLVSFDLDAQERWRLSLKPSVASVVSDVDGDGKPELICFEGGKLTVLDGATGEVQHERELEVENISSLYAAEDYILVLNPPFQGARAFDGELNRLWERPDIEHGGAASIADLNGDGELEAIVGHALLDNKGEILWQTQGAWRRVNPFQPRAIAVGKHNVETRIALACAKLGLLVLDLEGRVLHESHAGDVRTLCPGEFLAKSEYPGPPTAAEEIWLCTSWGNYGIRRLYNFAGREIVAFEPNNIPTPPFKVRWTVEKDLMLDASSAETFGLYDEEGNLVVTFPENATPKAIAIADLNGDGKDEVVVSSGEEIRIYGN